LSFELYVHPLSLPSAASSSESKETLSLFLWFQAGTVTSGKLICFSSPELCDSHSHRAIFRSAGQVLKSAPTFVANPPLRLSGVSIVLKGGSRWPPLLSPAVAYFPLFPEHRSCSALVCMLTPYRHDLLTPPNLYFCRLLALTS